jgi:hypothetical protein
MLKIRPFTANDWPMVESWWKRSGEVAPLPSMMPLESSFIAEVDYKPALAVAVYLTNTPELAYVENFIGNPEMKTQERKVAAFLLAKHISDFAKSRGFKRLLCMTEKPALVSRYLELGFMPTLSGVTTLVRET